MGALLNIGGEIHYTPKERIMIMERYLSEIEILKTKVEKTIFDEERQMFQRQIKSKEHYYHVHEQALLGIEDVDRELLYSERWFLAYGITFDEWNMKNVESGDIVLPRCGLSDEWDAKGIPIYESEIEEFKKSKKNENT